MRVELVVFLVIVKIPQCACGSRGRFPEHISFQLATHPCTRQSLGCFSLSKEKGKSERKLAEKAGFLSLLALVVAAKLWPVNT
jgi:hypothetical protein